MNIIDIKSNNPYPADVLSNFSPNEFEIDGVKCSGMEGFLQSLKFRSPARQREVCALTGKQAKAAGCKKKLWKLTGRLYWRGKSYKRGSMEFYLLSLCAYIQLFKNPVFRAALEQTKGCILTHSIGKHRMRETILTEEEFIGYLELLRRQI